MSLRSNIGLPLLLVASLAFPALAFSAPSTPSFPQEDPDEVCEAAIESQVWEDVVAKCEPLLSTHDESHPSWEFYKENVDYAHETIRYQYRTSCEEAAQAAAWDAVLANCDRALTAFPDYFPFHLYLGLAHQANQDQEKATSAFEPFLAGVEANPEAATQLGQYVAVARRQVALYHLSTGDNETALPLLREAAAANPSDVDLHFQLGRVLIQESDMAGAGEVFSAIIEQNPDNLQPQILFFAGRIAYSAQEFDTAAERLSKYLEAEPEGQYATEVHWMLGFIAGRSTDENGMMRHYGAALEADPNNPNARDANYSLGVIAFNRGQCSTAERYFRAFMRLARGDSRAADVEDMILDIEDGVCEGGF